MTAEPDFAGLPLDRPFTVATIGGTRRLVADAVRSGRFRQLLHGVYVSTELAATVEGRAACAGLVLPAGAAVSRRTAAWLHGVDARLPGEHKAPVRLECTVPTGLEPLSRRGLTCYAAPLDTEDVVEVFGVPCTTPRRTALDLLRWLPPHMGLGAADALAHLALVTPHELQQEVERWPGAPGIAKARALATLVEPLTESFGESWLRLRVVDAGFPVPRAQIELSDATGHVRFRLDLGWDDVKTGLEYDGHDFHASPDQQQHDAKRRARIQADHGWQVYGVTQAEVLGSSLRLERAIGGLLGMEPQLLRRRW